MCRCHITVQKKEDIAKTVLMLGDSLRAKFIAENYLENVQCVNTIRNMLAFTGSYKGKKDYDYECWNGNSFYRHIYL